jgi:hypothetical protein
MLEFIGGVVVMYLVLTWLLLMVAGKHSTTEIYVIREYVIKESIAEPPAHEVSARVPPHNGLPSNVLRFRR